MKVSSIENTTRYQQPGGKGKVTIEFAIPSDGGNSSAGQKYDFTEKSVRLAWRRENGGFDPISSSEIPDWGMLDIMEACAKKDFFSQEEIALMIKSFAESLIRQQKNQP